MLKNFPALMALGALLSGLALAPGQAAAATKKTPVKTTAAKAPARGTISKTPYLGAIAIDAATGKVLFEDQADAQGYPASTLKLMDLLIILEKIQRGEVTLQDPVPVSARAAKTGGSQVWLAEKETFTLDEMLYALMVQSANDAAVALAEKVAGSAEAFVTLMNAKARELGMTRTTFHSVHGLPPGQGQEFDLTTARDFAILCRALIQRCPEAIRYTSTREHTFRPNSPKAVIMRSHNHLLGRVAGCDGLKTGYIAVAGFSIAVTAAHNDQRVIAVVLGSADIKVRDAKAAELLAQAFAALPAAPAAPAPALTPVATKPAKK